MKNRFLIQIFIFVLSGLSGYRDLLWAEVPKQDPNVYLSYPAYDLKTIDEKEAPPRVGDQIKLQIAGLDLSSLSPFDLEALPGSDSILDQGWQLLHDPSSRLTDIIVVPLKFGKLTLPSLLIKNQEGKPIGRTNPFFVDVTTSIQPNDPTPKVPADLRPPLGLPFPVWIFIVSSIILLLLVTLVIWGLVYLSRKKRRNQTLPLVTPVLPLRTEDEIALEKLALLEKENLMLNGKFKIHFYKVSEILKTYLGARFLFDGPECTAQEIMELFEKRLVLSNDLMRELRNLFDDLDFVKFTDHFPTLEDGSKVLQGAQNFVMKSKRKKIEKRMEGQNAL